MKDEDFGAAIKFLPSLVTDLPVGFKAVLLITIIIYYDFIVHPDY